MWVTSASSVTPKLQFEIKMTFLHLAGILMENMSTHQIIVAAMIYLLIERKSKSLSWKWKMAKTQKDLI